MTLLQRGYAEMNSVHRLPPPPSAKIRSLPGFVIFLVQEKCHEIPLIDDTAITKLYGKTEDKERL